MIRRINPGETLSFEYTNHRGVTEARTAMFVALEFGSNEYYLEPQFLLRCYDYSRQADRSFAIANIKNWL